MSSIANTDDTVAQELAVCRLEQARLERELADLGIIIAGMEHELRGQNGQ